MVILPFCKQPGLCVATIVFLGDVNHRHESLKNHCDSEQIVKFEKYGWKNAVSSAYLMREHDFPSKFSAKEFARYATLNLFFHIYKNEMEADMSNIFQDIKDRLDLRDLVRFYGLDVNRGGFACCPFHNERNPSFKVYEDHYHCFGCGEHGDHVDFVQKLYGLSNIEAAKQINKDFGLGLETGEIAKPITTRPRKNDEFKQWLGESVHTLIEYKKLLAYWEKIYDPRSPIDKVNDRYLESIHNKAYVEHCVDTLLFGSEQDKRNFYETDREYPQRIKKRLDELDAVSRKAPKRAV